MDLDKAFKNFFAKRAAYPKPKKKGKSRDSFRFPQGFKIEEGNSRIYLPKIGWVRYRNSRALRGLAKNVTVSRHGERWYACVQTEFEVAEPIHPSTSQVGIDLGIARFASLSDGSFVLYPLTTNASSAGAATTTTYDLVIHGPLIDTVIIKSVPASVAAPAAATSVALSTGASGSMTAG